MSKNKVVTVDVKDKNPKPDDYSDCTDEERENINAFNKIMAEIESAAVTDVLKNLDFKTDIDKMVFNRLPLTTNQKEYLLLSVNSDYFTETIPKEHGIKKVKSK
jgi:hypothetical protein